MSDVVSLSQPRDIFISILKGYAQDLGQHLDPLQTIMGKLIQASGEPYSASPPFSGATADVFQRASALLIRETGYRVGGDAAAQEVAIEYYQRYHDEGIPGTGPGYQQGYTIGKEGIFGLLIDHLTQLCDPIDRHTNNAIDMILNAQQYQSSDVDDFLNNNQDQIIYALLRYDNSSNHSLQDLFNRIFQYGGNGLDVTSANDYVQTWIQAQQNYSDVPHDFGAINDASNNVIHIVIGWANAVYQAYTDWSAHFDDDVRMYLAQRDRSIHALFQTWQITSAQLASIDMNQENGNNPIGISTALTSDGQTAIVVTLAGTVPGHNPNGLLSVISDYFRDDSGYVSDAKAAIAAYLKEHGLPPDTPIILSGHSQGGMVAQDLASQADPSTFNVTEVIAYGSPDQKNNAHHVNEHLYYNNGDVIPFAPYTLDFPDGSPEVIRGSPPWLSYNELKRLGYTDQQIQAIVPDETHVDGGNTGDWLTNHGQYSNSKILQNTSLDFTITGNTEYYK